MEWHHHFSKKNDFLARPTHCLVRGSDVYKSFVRYQSVRKYNKIKIYQSLTSPMPEQRKLENI